MQLKHHVKKFQVNSLLVELGQQYAPDNLPIDTEDFSDEELSKLGAEELLLQCGLLKLTNEAGLQVEKTIRAMSKTRFVDDEIKECINKSEHVGKWFAVAGSTETIYISFGVRS